VEYRQFIDLVRKRTDVSGSRRIDGMPLNPTETAEILTRATLEVLAQRISGGQARDLAAHLPPELADALQPEHEKAEAFDLEVFIQRVADRALVDFDTARAGVRAVFETLREAVPGDEFRDVVSELPREYTALLEESE
jgi:uncharacterized protein (DUF2267 family)